MPHHDFTYDVIVVQRILVIFLNSEIVTLKLQAEFSWHFAQVFISKVTFSVTLKALTIY